MLDLTQHDHQSLAVARPATDLATLLQLNDVAFVGAAYLTLLRRPADVDGLAHYLNKLRSGSTKVELLHALCTSREGRSNGAELPGLYKAIRRYKLLRVPVLGGLLRWLTGAEGFAAEHRRQRAIEQVLVRQLAESRQQHAELLASLAAISIAASQSIVGTSIDQPDALQADLVVQPRGQTRSMLANFIKLQRGPAEDVLAQLSELVAASHEAELLGGAGA